MAEKQKRPTKPHFFQPLLPGFQHQLSVPVSFYLQHLKGENPEKAVLRSPINGKLWHVKMKGRLIEDGWQEFSEEHQLHVGDFCVFRYDGDFVFDVLVFDPSSCQREYSSFNVKQTPPEVKEEDIPEEQEEGSSGNLTKKKKDTAKFEGKPGPSASQYPHFMKNLTSYAANCPILTIPKEFARANGLENRCCKIVLLNEQGKVWMGHLGFKQRDGQPYIKHCWTAFRCANSLKAGDFCVFELIRDGEKPVLKITRCTQEYQPNPTPKKQPTYNVARAGAGSSSGNLHVHVIVKQSYINNNRLRIPIKFAMKSGIARECPEEMTIRNEGGRSWTVSLLKSETGGFRIGQGWRRFARSNGIKAGDFLMLELVRKGKKPVVRISVVEGAESEKNSVEGAKRGAESEKNSSGTPADVEAVAEIKQEVDIM